MIDKEVITTMAKEGNYVIKDGYKKNGNLRSTAVFTINGEEIELYLEIYLHEPDTAGTPAQYFKKMQENMTAAILETLDDMDE